MFSNNSLKHTTEMISDEQREIILIVNLVIISSVIGLFGSVANVINMIVFYRQGLNTTTNISFFYIAISDLCSLIFQQFYNMFVNPLFVDLDLPIVYTDVQFLLTAAPREIFARITCLITAFIAAERCICVVFPLHVKRIITPKVAASVIFVIYVSTVITVSPVFYTDYYRWTFYPDLNRTLLSLAFTRSHALAEAVVYFTHALLTLLGFLSVLTFTLILIHKLGQKSAWRQTANVDLEKAKSMTKRDRATITMVVLIAGILVVCYTPAVIVAFLTFLVPEFSVTGRHYNLYHSFWSFAMLLEVVNSSVNIFLYYKMSTKYRHTFRNLLSACLRLYKVDISNRDIAKLSNVDQY